MLSRENFIRYSLEVNLFFLRLAKEHAILAAASLPPRDLQVSLQLIALKNNMEMLLYTAVMLSNQVISADVLSSKEIVTDLTLPAEIKTQFLTGIPINTNITKMELALKHGVSKTQNPLLFEQVSILNQQAIMGLNFAIAFKEKLLSDILNCKAFSYAYPEMINHIIIEERFFTVLPTKLQNMEDMDSINEFITEQLKLNWNEIMGDHAEYIRGYLDPSEAALFEAVDAFVKEFDKLPRPGHSPEATEKSLKATTNLRNFKVQGTQEILSCKVRSVIPPLLGDHVTREANHYLRLLKALTNIRQTI